MTQIIKWQCASFNELTGAQIYAILQARSEVFIMEQNCVYQDMDGLDLSTLHVIGWAEDEKVAAYLRIVAPNIKFPEPSIGRVISTSAFRGSGIGRQLITEGLKQLEAHYPSQAVRISAQAYLQEFYKSFGFVAVSEEYLEDDIPHIEMLRPVSSN
ncbi:GNAT family N-acetyltransferase [Solimicrobium silvestre]|uniref:Putative acyltransferase n=1 Tax=Solimicrobium silvestre TaxID=2099400 RepID=A0A2S9GXF3_9BURK|nr:GNAT family N-acetyltransferase [Solimicrobium silvestre]PRC92391.1 putative acyltransferase [Solimicrobium silvestre]